MVFKYITHPLVEFLIYNYTLRVKATTRPIGTYNSFTTNNTLSVVLELIEASKTLTPTHKCIRLVITEAVNHHWLLRLCSALNCRGSKEPAHTQPPHHSMTVQIAIKL